MKKDVKSNEYKTGGRSATYVIVICTLLLNIQGVGFLLIVFWGMMVMVGQPVSTFKNICENSQCPKQITPELY